MPNRMLALASSSLTPMALSTCDGSAFADVHAEPEDNATSGMASRMESASVCAKDRFNVPGRVWRGSPFNRTLSSCVVIERCNCLRNEIVRRVSVGPSAMHLQPQALTHIAANLKSADAFRTIKLVAAERSQAHIQPIHVHVYLAQCLRCIGMQHHAFTAAQKRYRRHILHGAGFVVDEHDRYQIGAIVDGGGKLIQIDASGVVDTHV